MDHRKISQLKTARLTRRKILSGLVGLGALPLLQARESPSAATAPTKAAAPPPAQPTQAAPAKVGGTVVLKWQSSNLGEAQLEPIWKAAIPKFEAENPNIKIEPIPVPRVDEWTKFITAAKANAAPDICTGNTLVIDAAYQGLLTPLDAFWNAESEAFRNTWPKGCLEACMWQGKLYGMPEYGGVYGEFYNKDLVKQAGLDISKPPTNWSDYLDWMKKLTKSDQQWGTAILGGKTDTTTRTLLGWIWANGGEAFNKDMTQATFASNPKSLEAIEFYVGLDVTHGVVAPGAVNINYLEQTTLFAREKVASMHTAFWGVAKVLGENPAIKGKIAVAFRPMNTGTKVTVSQVTSDFISKDCKNPEAAWKFLKFWNDREWVVRRALEANWMPLRTDVANDPRLQKDPLLVQFLEFGKSGRGYPLPHPLWMGIAVIDVVPALQAALLKQGTVKEVFSKLDETITKKLKEM